MTGVDADLRIRALLLGMLLLASIALVLLFRAYWLERIDAANLRLDPHGLTLYPEETRPQTDNRVLVFFGDSRAKAWPAPDWPKVTTINRGIDGQSSAQLRGRLQQHVLKLQPDMVVIQAGINDLRQIAQFPEREADITAACTRNLRETVAALRAQNIRVVISTIFPYSSWPTGRINGWSARVDTAISTVNAELRALAVGDPGILVLDSDALLTDGDRRVQLSYAQDALHINAAGYARLNEALGKLPLELER